MREQRIRRVTTDELPRIRQKLRLRCGQCDDVATYDVGTIFCDPEDESASAKVLHTFTNYFRCRKCASAGPWEVADYLKLIGLRLRASVSKGFEGLYLGRCTLFDATVIQTPALGEDYLRKLILKDPRNPFLCSRLANLFRSCGQIAWATEWYEHTLHLDPGDLESHYHLHTLAVKAGDIPAALSHATSLIRHLLKGRVAEKPELTKGMAVALVESLRNAREEFRRRFLDDSEKNRAQPEHAFIRSLLNADGDKDEIIDDAVECLLTGEIYAGPDQATPVPPGESSEPDLDLIPSLREVVSAEGLVAKRLTVGVEVDDRGKIAIRERNSVPLHDGKKTAFWTAPPLRELFRGNKKPPSDTEMNRYPPEYRQYFYFVENHVLMLCDTIGDRTDQEFEEVYATLRRRPDGKSLGPTHDFLWQVAAVLLAKHALSQAEFDALFGQLARSTRHWAVRPISRNYMNYVRRTLEQESS